MEEEEQYLDKHAWWVVSGHNTVMSPVSSAQGQTVYLTPHHSPGYNYTGLLLYSGSKDQWEFSDNLKGLWLQY